MENEKLEKNISLQNFVFEYEGKDFYVHIKGLLDEIKNCDVILFYPMSEINSKKLLDIDNYLIRWFNENNFFDIRKKQSFNLQNREITWWRSQLICLESYYRLKNNDLLDDIVGMYYRDIKNHLQEASRDISNTLSTINKYNFMRNAIDYITFSNKLYHQKEVYENKLKKIKSQKSGRKKIYRPVINKLEKKLKTFKPTWKENKVIDVLYSVLEKYNPKIFEIFMDDHVEKIDLSWMTPLEKSEYLKNNSRYEPSPDLAKNALKQDLNKIKKASASY